MRYRAWVPVGVLAITLGVAACGSSQSSTSASGTAHAAAPKSPSAARATLKTEKTGLGTVLANAKGDTLYWFSKDTSTSSACTGQCAVKWPPVLGTAQPPAGASLSGKFGTITRANGATQATYDGHPLYTFVGDTAPGQTHGNLLNVFGGIWYAVTTSAAPASSPSPSSSSGSSGGYGSGY